MLFRSFSLSEKLSIFTNIATNPKEILAEANIEEDSMDKLKDPEIIKFSKILSVHTKQRNTRLCRKFQNTYVCRQVSLKPCNTTIGLKSLPFKNNHENFEQLSSLRKKEKGHRICIEFRYQEQPFQKNKYLFTKEDHTSQRVGFSNQISLHDIFSGYHKMIPL